MKDVEQLLTLLQNQSEGGDVTGAHQTAELILDACNDAVDLVKAGKYLENVSAQSDARRAFERAVAITPDFALAHSSLGLLSLDEGDIEHAVAHFREAVRLEPRDVGKLALLGVACCDAGMEEEGRNSLMRALEIDVVALTEILVPRGHRAEMGMIDAPAIKMLVRLRGAPSADMRATLAPLVGDRADITYSTDHGLIELSAPGVSKASGLATVAQRLGVEHSAIIAFGDMPNDVPMLTMVGHGVAMANAHEEALAAANEVTAANFEDGVAQVLERWWV